QLANLLRPFGVRSKNVRVGVETPKGYRLADLSDAFRRYLGDAHPPPPPQRNTDGNLSATPAPPHGGDVAERHASVSPRHPSDVADVADPNAEPRSPRAQLGLFGHAQGCDCPASVPPETVEERL